MTLGAAVALMVSAPVLLLLFRQRERHRTEDRVRYAAAHDALTGLPNRSQFTDRLAHVLDRAEDARRGGAVLLVNVDRFRAINESYGHAAGDAVLRAVAERLRSAAGPDDVVARLAVDEFALLTEAHSQASAVHALAERVAAALGKPHVLSGRSVAATVSLGVALFPRDGHEPEPLLRNAGLALEQAKADGGDAIRFFEGELAEAVRRRRRLEHDLRIALATDALDVHYQPQFDLATGALKGCEALARWRHPSLGPVPPGEFIPIAEETGLISLLGEWVLRRACRDASRWPVPVKVAVNLSPAQFRKGAIAPVVQRALAETGLPAARLELEVTESVLLADTEATLAELRRLRDIGVAVAMDDFGTGYSSLISLSRFPFSKIKIDRSFVQRLTDDPGVATIVKAIVSLGRALHVTITAEGVETGDQAVLLRRIGCHEAQGYLYGRPMPAGEFAAQLAETPGAKPASMAAQVA
jgi:diguanylate cyclase (GGDEF)-like protein